MNKQINNIIKQYYQGESLFKHFIMNNKSILEAAHLMYTLERISVIEDVLRADEVEGMELNLYGLYKKDIKKIVEEINNESRYYIEKVNVGNYSKQIKSGALRRSYFGLSPSDNNVGIDPKYNKYDLLIIVDSINKTETYIEYKILDKMVSDKNCDIYIKSIHSSFDNFKKDGRKDYEDIDLIQEPEIDSCITKKEYIEKVVHKNSILLNNNINTISNRILSKSKLESLRIALDKNIYNKSNEDGSIRESITILYEFIIEYRKERLS